MEETVIAVNSKGETGLFILGFFNPGLFGIYVFTAVLSAVIFGVFYHGYGCWFRAGGFQPLGRTLEAQLIGGRYDVPRL